MISPTADDLGRKVTFQTEWTDDYGRCHIKVEDGIVTSFNDSFVFVRYGSDANSKATRRQDLDWIPW